ncbi:MAG: UDP-N-acetylmuramoyl-tripeptide--D-alanyl-D-alanine ligase [Gammaproteobacteria bacterium]|nr:UDP-N-acetylmuramoyl-tripeptide--D-alanyl-D-alanine ligase [Gammaproteobacteria bacterium]MBU1654205.1 UDP-N-acetylmuramoyl-tripeptide--D-alanyl-D-alanine ligase [Gammaproteobacteria bacterium]MBU1960865.1 UDP-N-acetylmuramoyl-tripeptide--D-alanyl-D-alanine ligase [Gammaproteobacteria bacterium]
MRLSEAALAVGGRLIGPDLAFSAVSTDSRQMEGAPLFIALRGERFDGHEYLEQVAAAGAVAVMVERESALPIPQLIVADTRLALGRLAAVWRDRANPRLIGVTGSNGKTTLKEMLRAILGAEEGGLLATEGNLNNDIGLPLTLLRLQGERTAVIEMGANHPGEIGYLTAIARPDVAVLNNAGRAHLEGFGSLEGVARAKAEIIQGIKPDGCFVYNADSPWAGLWQGLSEGRKRLGFGLSAQADVRGPSHAGGTLWTEQGFVNRFPVETPDGAFEVELRLAGGHNRMNALAAIAACQALGVGIDRIKQGLAGLEPVKGRLRVSFQRGFFLIDDSYNANPDSVEAAMEVLRQAPGRRYLVLGDLAELGPRAAELHQELGIAAKAAGIDRLYAVGLLSTGTVEGFGEGGVLFPSQESLVDRLRAELNTEASVLVKGSRSSAMDRVVAALI